MTSPDDPHGSTISDNQIYQSQRSTSKSSFMLHAYRDRATSPTSTLRNILSKDRSDKPNQDERVDDATLLHSYQSASPEQIKFAENVFDTTASLKAWSEELESWFWPGSFEHESGTAGTSAGEYKKEISATNHCTGYVEPLLRIRSGLEGIDIIEMKQHVLDIYLHTNPDNLQLPMQNTKRPAATGHFTALVSVVLLQALPCHLKVSSLATLWSARIAVSKLAPSFFTFISQATDSLSDAWAAISSNGEFESKSKLPMTINSVEDLAEARIFLQGKVSAVGQVLDYMLDLLEGLDDTLPDAWIDQVDELEADYGDWIVAAEKWLLRRQASDNEEQLVANDSAVPIMPGEHSLDEEEAPIIDESQVPPKPAEDKDIHGQNDQLNGTSYLADPSESESEERELADLDQSSQLSLSDDRTLTEPHERAISDDQPPNNEEPFNIIPGTDNAPTFLDSEHESDFSDEASMDDSRDDLIDSYYGTVDSAREEHNIAAEETQLEQESSRIIEVANVSDPKDNSDDSDALPEIDIENGIDDQYDTGGGPTADDDDEPSVLADTSTIESWPGREPESSNVQDSEPLFGQSIQKERNQSLSTDEKLERQIGSILTSIPTRIDFKRNRLGFSTNSRPFTPEPRTTEQKGPRDPISRSSTPALTLAPAETKEPRAAKFSGDSPIRLYYLWQAGRSKPIKLFVRLVGENGERVMVRVGGGWAELAEYLREYANHHSRTIIPEPHEALQAVDLRQPSNSRVFSLTGAKLDTNSSSSPPRMSSPGGEDVFGSSPPQRIAKMPDDSLLVAKSRSTMKSPDNSSSLQDVSPAAGTGYPENMPAQGAVHSIASSPINSEKKGWPGRLAKKAKKWKTERGANSSPSSTLSHSPTSANLENAEVSK